MRRIRRAGNCALDNSLDMAVFSKDEVDKKSDKNK
jgi:hypothetical protein